MRLSFNDPGSSGHPDADALAIALFKGTIDPSRALESAIHAIGELDSRAVAAPDAGLLVCALLATTPHMITPDLVEALRSVIARSDLMRTWQPSLDEAFQLLSLLVRTDLTESVARVATDVLRTEGLHPRWARKSIGLLMRTTDLRPTAIDVSELISIASALELPEMQTLVQQVVIPTLLSDPRNVNLGLLEQSARLVGSNYELRYLLAALKDDERAPDDVREYASAAISRAFPLAEPIRQRLSGNTARILCIQNIADGQGDEIVRVVPLLQALLDTYPDASAIVVTDRGYLYRHSRITTMSFDETDRIRASLTDRIDVLLEFVDDEQPQLNHDPLLPRVVSAVRSSRPPAIDIGQAKRWNEFVFNRVLIDGMDWASALAVDRPFDPNVYDPVMRLIAELGMPLRVGEQRLSGELVLAGQDSTDASQDWTQLTGASAGRPIALLNPFGGNAPLKGFTRTVFPDLAALIRQLVEEGFGVVIAPSGQPWGTSEVCRRRRAVAG